jgi:hypothetical protein
MKTFFNGLRSIGVLVPSLLAFGGTAAHAADNGFYLGAGVTQAKVDDVFDTNLKLDDTGYKIIAGFRPLDLIAVEANYMDLGNETRNLGLGSAGQVDAKAFAAFGLLFLPIPIVDVYAKLGLARWELDGQLNAGSSSLFSTDDSGTELAYGAGAQLQFGSLGARLEYESFDIDNTDGADLISLGFTYTFL